MTTAAGIIIGDEILSGKVTDTNTPLLVELLRSVGVRLRRIAVVSDDLAAIGQEVRACAASHDYVITSGGVGPTHDDVTMEAIARAFDRPLVRHPHIEQSVRHYFGARVNEAALKLAELPDGARLIHSQDSLLPVVAFQNIYILPGVPQIFRAKLQALSAELRGEPVTLANLYLGVDESAVAAILTQVVAESPEVQIGSYPRYGDPEVMVRVTVESQQAARVEAALARLIELLPKGQVLRVDRA